MFGKMQSFMQQMQMVNKLMRDENFKAFISHPKIQTIFSDPEFQKSLQTKNPDLMMNHPKLAPLRNDPEIAALLAKVDFQKLIG